MECEAEEKMIIKGTDLRKLPDDEIYNLYVNNNFSLKKLARRYDVDKGTIKSRLTNDHQTRSHIRKRTISPAERHGL